MLTEPGNHDPALFKVVIEAMSDGVAVFDMAGRVVLLNEAQARINGYATVDDMRRDLDYFAATYALYAEDGREVPVAEWPVSRVLRGESVSDLCLRAFRKDTGLDIWVCFSGNPVRDSSGSLILAVVISRDITREKRNQAELHRSEEKYRGLLATLDDGFGIIRMIFDDAGRPVDYLFLETNPAFERHTGLKDARGRRVRELVPDLDRSWFELYGKVARTGEAMRFENFAPAMGRWFDVYAMRLGDPREFLVALLFRDITSRKRAEETLREREEFLRRVLDNLFAFVGVMETDGTLIMANRAPLDAAGISLEDVIGKKVWDTYWFSHSEEERRRLREACERALRGEAVRRDMVIRVAGDQRLIIDFQLAPLRNAQGRITHLIPSAVDVTERSRADKERRKFELLVQASNDYVALLDPDGAFTFLNRGGRVLVGLDPEKPLELRMEDCLPPEERGALAAAFRHALAEGRWQGELPLRHALTGQAMPAWWNIFPLRAPGAGPAPTLAVVARDLTLVREKDEQLRQAQKVEAIGQLAGGVAHDFNNLLTAINGYSDMLLESAAQDDPKREFLLEIHKSGQRAAALTSQLLAYSRKQVLQLSVVDLNAVVAESVGLLGRVIGENIELELALAPDLLALKADPNQLHQVLLNLCLNSRDAMPNGGRIRISTSNAGTGGAQEAAGPSILLEVADTGTGMTPEVQRRIFEPFYTTKGVGKGTGLGLSSVLGIVQQSGGGIAVESRPGSGTVFRLRFPALPEEARRAETEALAEEVREVLRRGSILLVEDEETVRRFVRSLLEREGYTVLEARDGLEALGLLSNPEVRPDLVLSDVIMPRMGGPQLAAALRTSRPGLRVLLMSGYTEEALSQHPEAGEGVQVIQKPFSPQSLTARIQDLLHPAAT